MEANELMIGDWVGRESHKNTPQQVIGIGDKGVTLKLEGGWCGEAIDLIEPIPLTPNILEKNGFVREKVTYVPVLYVLYINHPIYIKASKTVYIMFHDNYIGITISHIAGKMRQMDGAIEYVHELQHALRLAGIKKEIVL